MITSEEIAEVPLFGSLSPADRQRLSKTCADLRLAAGEYAVHEGEDRALFVVLEGRIEVVKQVDGIERVLGERVPGAIFGEVPITLGTAFPSGFRAAEPSRVMQIDVRPVLRGRSGGSGGRAQGRRPRARAHRRAPGRRRRGPEAACAASSATAGTRPAPICAASSIATRSRSSGSRRTRSTRPSAWGGGLPADDDLPALRAAGTTLVRPALRARRRPARPADERRRRRLRRRHRRRRARRSRRRRVRGVGGPAHDRDRARGAWRPGRHVVPHRELPRLPRGVSGDELSKRALQQARRLGAEILVTRAITGLDPAARTVRLDGGDELRGRTIILATGVTWRHLAIPGIEPLIGKGIYYGAARSEAAGTHGLEVHLVGAGNSAGQAALFFANHARTVTVICRGEALEKSMSQYLVDQVRRKSNIEVAVRRRGRRRRTARPARGDRHRRPRERRDRSRCPSGGLFIFIGADADTGWLPPEIALDGRGYVLTGAEVAAGDAGARPRPLPARDERAGHLRVRRRALQPGQARGGSRRRGQHGHRLRAPVPAPRQLTRPARLR